MTNRSGKPGFTLVELIVAMGIFSLMMLLINQLFNDTTRAITTGIATGDIIVGSEIIGNAMHRDAASMRAPSLTTGDAGFLVIVNRVIGDTHTADGVLDISNNEGVLLAKPNATDRRLVRSDQLVFATPPVSSGEVFRSITPYSNDDVANPITSGFARVWYGHVNLEGNTPAANTRGDHWALGRQAMLFDFDPSVATGSPTYYDHDETPPQVKDSSYASGNALEDSLTDVTDATSAGLLASLAAGTASATFNEPLVIQPNAPFAVDRSTSSNFHNWELARKHVLLSQHVSDFIVEFAGDYTAPAGIDLDGNNNIIWYGLNAPGGKSPNTTIFTDSTPNPSFSEPSPNVECRYAWHVNDTTNWPMLLRIRYRLHASNGRVISTFTPNLSDNFDNDGDQVAGEPNGVDDDGINGIDDAAETNIDEDDEKTVSGRWFEHILKVNRP